MTKKKFTLCYATAQHPFLDDEMIYKTKYHANKCLADVKKRNNIQPEDNTIRVVPIKIKHYYDPEEHSLAEPETAPEPMTDTIIQLKLKGITHQEIGAKKLERLIETINDFCTVEGLPQVKDIAIR